MATHGGGGTEAFTGQEPSNGQRLSMKQQFQGLFFTDTASEPCFWLMKSFKTGFQPWFTDYQPI